MKGKKIGEVTLPLSSAKNWEDRATRKSTKKKKKTRESESPCPWPYRDPICSAFPKIDSTAASVTAIFCSEKIQFWL